MFRARGGEGKGGRGPPGFLEAAAAPPAVPSERAEPPGVSGRVAGPDFLRSSPRPLEFASSVTRTRLRLPPVFGLLGPARRASRPAALRLVSAGRAGAAPAGALHPGPAAVMLLRLPPLRPGGQRAEAGAGARAGARSPLAGTPPSPVLGSRGRRGTPGPRAA